jgi:hypothetical protein
MRVKRFWRTGLGWCAAVLVAAGVAHPAAGGAEARPPSLASTLSGLPAIPFEERSRRVGAGLGIRFRAPATIGLATVHTHWRRTGSTCSLTLHADAPEGLGPVLARAAVGGEASGWVATPLAAALERGAVYHLVAACEASDAGRLGYTLDRDPTAVAGGSWQLEEIRGSSVRGRRPPASPLFALVFADGTWWGQPYRAALRRPLVRVCGAHEAVQTIVPRVPMAVTGVQLTAGRGGWRNGPSFTLSEADGSPLLGGPLARQRRNGAPRALALTDVPVELTPGTPYTLHVKGMAGERCARQRALATDLPLGLSLRGIDAGELRLSADNGASWRVEPTATLAVTLIGTPPPVDVPPSCGDGRLDPREECDGAADAACPGRCQAACTCGAPPPACGNAVVDGGEQCDGVAEEACPGRCTTACTCTEPPPGCGNGQVGEGEECDGLADAACPGRCTAGCACAEPPPTCGDGRVAEGEECDGAADAACPGRCTAGCMCEPAPRCGDGRVDAGEACDGAADAACPGRCNAACGCEPLPPPPPPPPAAVYKSIYAGGYIGHYDPATIPVWPKRLGLMLGEAVAQGPLIAEAKRVAAAAGNHDAKFIFYLSLTTLDSRCQCYEQTFFQRITNAHPEWFLRDTSGNRVYNFIDQYGPGRLYVVDIGNPAYVDAWASYVLGTMDRYGWDGVFADNILRGNFYAHSAIPVNPRTGARYTTAEYRRDLLQALYQLRARLEARGKIIIGNHSNAWLPDTFTDPVVQEQVLAMHGGEIEDCVYTFGGQPHSETNWLAQLRYLDHGNRNGRRMICNGPVGVLGDTAKRTYVLASYLLTKEGLSSINELNTLGAWRDEYATDLGAPKGRFTCLDPGNGLAPASSCPSTGKIYSRGWEKGRVLVNPTGATVTVPLGQELLLRGSRVRSVTLAPKSGAVLVRP